MMSESVGNRFSSLFKCLLLVLFGLSLKAGHAAEIPDYYSEPGINPHRAYVNQNFGESIDPFTGKLQLHYTDVFLPGQGGFDLKIQRSYTSLDEELPPGASTSIIGMGWDMHFGLMVKPGVHAGCSNDLLDTADNPVLTLADGSQEVFAAPSQAGSVFGGSTPDYISKNRWIANCSVGSGGLEWTVYSPGGLKYELAKGISSPTQSISALRRVSDNHGNTLTFEYFGDDSLSSTYNSKPFVKRITGSDGRVVTFDYYDSTTAPYAGMRLRSITVNGQVTTYNYRQVGATNHYRLVQVDLPGNDSGFWNYRYLVDDNNLFANVPGRYSIDRVDYPYGGAIEYTYTRNFFLQDDGKLSDAIKTKTTLDGGATVGQWTYDYKPGYESFLAGELDKTTVTMPDGTAIYQHFGLQSAGVDETWKIGLLNKVITCQIGVTCTETNAAQVEEYTWDYRTVSAEDFAGPRSRKDGDLRQPILTKKVIARQQGNVYTTVLSNFDNYGNAQRVVETGNDSRTGIYKYYRNNANWIVNRLEDETILDAATIDGVVVDAKIDRSFDALGNLLSVDKFGVPTRYSYYGDGNVATVTNARDKTTTFKDYYRGVARTEEQPEGITIQRTVNATGTLATQTDGRGNVTGFGYDALNRLSAIDFPINSDVVITRTPNSKTLVRGNYRERLSYDGFGRTVSKQSADIVRGVSLSTTTRYDALGRKVFESYPNSPEGTAYRYDVLGRLTQKTLNDGSTVEYTYVGSNRVRIKDERGNVTTQQFRAYGSPGDGLLVRTESPEDVITTITRDKLGNVTQMWQGNSLGAGSARGFAYDSRFYVKQQSNPETGITYIGRDANGNMTSLQVGAGGPTRTFVYDALDRLVAIDYPDPTPDVTYVYDQNGNLKKVSNEVSQRIATYDENDNLTQEEVTIEDVLYTIKYAYDAHDILGAITYPTGRVVNYQPDALGRPTKAEPFLDSVTYHPTGHPHTLVYHNGETTEYTLNDRRRIEAIQGSGVSDSIGLHYGYDTAGNITGITNSLDGTYSRSMLYDGLNRLDYAQGGWGIEDYAYSETGDIESIGFGGSDSNTYSYANNRLASIDRAGSVENFSYDSYGNITGNSSYGFYYNDAQQLELAIPDGADVSFVFAYDGNGMRVVRRKNNQTTKFVYTASGQLLGEYPGEIPKAREYFYLNGQRIATATVPNHLTADAGPDLTVNEGDTVTLDASGSSMFGQPIDTFLWKQVAGLPIALNGNNQAVVSFTAPTGYQDYSLRFRLRVNNYRYNTFDLDTVFVTVKMVDADGDSLSDFWETEHYGGIAVVAADDDTDGDGLSALEEFIAQTDPEVQTTPAPAKRITAIPGNGEVRITWMDADNAKGYDLYWSESPDVTVANGTRIADVTSPYTHTGLTNGQPYHYIVVAKNACCEQSSTQARVVPGLSGWTTPAEMPDIHNLASGGYVDKAFKAVRDRDGYPGHIAVESYNQFDGWGEPVVVQIDGETGAGDDPAIAMGGDGSAIALWVQEGTTLTARHYSRATGWAEQYSWTLGNPDTRVSAPIFIGIQDNGNATILVSVTDGASSDTSIYSIDYSPQEAWSGAQLIHTIRGHLEGIESVAMSRSGYLAFLFNASEVTSTDLSRWVMKRDRNKNWGEPIKMAPYFSKVLPGSLAISESGRVAALIDPPHQRLMLWREAIATGDPILEIVSDDEVFDPSIGSTETLRTVYDDAGRLTVAWSPILKPNFFPPPECNVQPELAERIYYRQFTPETGWSEQQRIPIPLPPGSDCYSAFDNFDMFQDAAGDVHLIANAGAGEAAYGTTQALDGTRRRALLDYRLKYREGIRYPIDIYSWFSTDEFVPVGVSAYPDRQGNAAATFGGKGGPRLGGDYRAFSEYVRVANAPNANAGINGEAVSQSTVTLDGSQSSSPESGIASYAWRQLAGPEVILSDPTSASPSFTAPDIVYRETLWFELTVTDNNGLLDKDTVRVTLYPPGSDLVIDPGADEVVMEGATVTLDASGTNDPDGKIRNLFWIPASLPLVELQYAETNPSVLLQWVASFVAPEVEEETILTFKVVAIDGGGRSYYGYKQVTVRNNTGSRDVTPPTVTPPADLEVEATALLTPVDLGGATAVDDVDGAIEPLPDATGPFALGVYTITWSATDSAGNTGTAVQTLSVKDTTAPVLSLPADVAVSASAPLAVDIGQASATDIFGPVSITNDAPPEFPLGETLVTWSATDQNGNTSQATQSVNVTLVDTSSPVVTAPPPVRKEATAIDTPVDLGAASALDDVDGPITPTPDWAGPFPLGLHSVTWSATDQAGNRGTATQTVEIVDTTPPSLNVPAGVEVESEGPTAVDIGNATADDLFTPVLIENDAPSLFPLGTTIVKWKATDANGNVAMADQRVDVVEPASNTFEELLRRLWDFLKDLFGW